MKVEFSYLKRQFGEVDEIIQGIRSVVSRGDYTLGKEVKEFEEKFAKFCGTLYAIGVNSGTDALFLSMKALGIGLGDEVITVPYTFFATVGAIVATGARPVFVDVNNEYLMDTNKIEAVITERTKAILPVQWAGNICDMDKIMALAAKYSLFMVEDACQSVGALLNDKMAGSFGNAGAFSMHPLKNLNVWGDGGIIATNSQSCYKKLLLLRNHGLIGRNICQEFAYNSRLHTVQAAVALHALKNLSFVTNKRMEIARYYDGSFKNIPQLKIPPRPANKKHVFHLYILLAENRNGLLRWLLDNDIDAKIHYPTPLHLQPASAFLGYKEGSFPVCESQAKSIISLPLHQHLTDEEIDFVVDTVQKFYKK